MTYWIETQKSKRHHASKPQHEPIIFTSNWRLIFQFVIWNMLICPALLLPLPLYRDWCPLKFRLCQPAATSSRQGQIRKVNKPIYGSLPVKSSTGWKMALVWFGFCKAYLICGSVNQLIVLWNSIKMERNKKKKRHIVPWTHSHDQEKESLNIDICAQPRV